MQYLNDEGITDFRTLKLKVGVNTFYLQKSPIYYDRAHTALINNLKKLQKEKYIVALPDNKFRITKTGKDFLLNSF